MIQIKFRRIKAAPVHGPDLIQVMAARTRHAAQWRQGRVAPPRHPEEITMHQLILLPTDGHPGAAPAIASCMARARECGASVSGLYVLPPEDCALPEDDHYRLDTERPSSILRASEALRQLKEAAAAAGVPCTVQVHNGDTCYTCVAAVAQQQRCEEIWLDALACPPSAGELALLRRSATVRGGAAAASA